MYIAQKKRENRHQEMVYYFYKAESTRVDGKVRNIQKYMTNFRVSEMEDKDKFDEKIEDLTERFGYEAVEKMMVKIRDIVNAG